MKESYTVLAEFADKVEREILDALSARGRQEDRVNLRLTYAFKDSLVTQSLTHTPVSATSGKGLRSLTQAFATAVAIAAECRNEKFKPDYLTLWFTFKGD